MFVDDLLRKLDVLGNLFRARKSRDRQAINDKENSTNSGSNHQHPVQYMDPW
jgi:hypothetical protein